MNAPQERKPPVGDTIQSTSGWSTDLLQLAVGKNKSIDRLLGRHTVQLYSAIHAGSFVDCVLVSPVSLEWGQ